MADIFRVLFFPHSNAEIPAITVANLDGACGSRHNIIKHSQVHDLST